MARQKKWNSEAERLAAYRKRKKDEALSAVEEQQIRDSYGYAPSESRSYAERAEVAERIMAKLDPEELAWAKEMWASQARAENDRRILAPDNTLSEEQRAENAARYEAWWNSPTERAWRASHDARMRARRQP